MTPTISTLLYLVAGTCFIMALRGLSSAATARSGNLYGICGMVISILTTLLTPAIAKYSGIVGGIAIGGIIGAIIARKIKMTALPQLVAAFHSLVGLAAVFVAGAALYNPSAFGIGTVNAIYTASSVEMSIGTIIGAITFSGSVVAFGKLQGLISGRPLVFPKQHFVNAILGLGLIGVVVFFAMHQHHGIFWLMTAVS